MLNLVPVARTGLGFTGRERPCPRERRSLSWGRHRRHRSVADPSTPAGFSRQAARYSRPSPFAAGSTSRSSRSATGGHDARSRPSRRSQSRWNRCGSVSARFKVYSQISRRAPRMVQGRRPRYPARARHPAPVSPASPAAIWIAARYSRSGLREYQHSGIKFENRQHVPRAELRRRCPPVKPAGDHQVDRQP